jgi:hypothetical protein
MILLEIYNGTKSIQWYKDNSSPSQDLDAIETLLFDCKSTLAWSDFGSEVAIPHVWSNVT